MVIETINSIGESVASSVSLFIRVNHWVNDNVVAAALAIASLIKAALCGVAQALVIALEDLALFLVEVLEDFVSVVEVAFGCIDAVLTTAISSCLAVKSAVVAVASALASSAANICSATSYALLSVGHLVNLTYSSFVFLMGLAPKALYLIGSGLGYSLGVACNAVATTVASAHERVLEAPLEICTGLVASLLIAASLKRIHARSGMTIVLQLLCFVYFYMMKSLIFGARCLISLVEITLSHLHVTRFHHAGDSDAEEEVGGDRGVAGSSREVIIDESDENENERMVDKRRNYDLLLKRRAQKKSLSERQAAARKRLKGGGSRKSDEEGESEEDVEELLFEQVEREREDKLCVVCQDKEKCIMILPCRHLCICQDCQEPLRARHNHCPICRRPVRQTIKAYL